jgi:hypothetical protein
MPTPLIPRTRLRTFVICVWILLFATACAAPVGVRRIDPRAIRLELSSSVLTSSKLSAATRNVLRVADLEDEVERRPEEVIALVQRILLENAQQGDIVFRALAVDPAADFSAAIRVGIPNPRKG